MDQGRGVVLQSSILPPGRIRCRVDCCAPVNQIARLPKAAPQRGSHVPVREQSIAVQAGGVKGYFCGRLFARICLTRSTGIASTVRNRDCTVVARSSEL
jgi:hypothetical protein